MQKIKRRKLFKHWWSKLIVIILLLILFLAISWGVYVLYLTKKILRGEIDVGQFANQITKSQITVAKKENFNIITADDPSWGPKDAPITIVEFADFQCPFSRQSFPVAREILASYPGKIRFIYRDFPLSDIHPYAQKAAEAAQCANDQGKFWPMYDKLFQNQKSIDFNNFKLFALNIGLDQQEFDRCLDSGKYKEEVIGDLIDGASAGVEGTPTWFINGVKIAGAIPLDMFKKIIESELARLEK